MTIKKFLIGLLFFFIPFLGAMTDENDSNVSSLSQLAAKNIHHTIVDLAEKTKKIEDLQESLVILNKTYIHTMPQEVLHTIRSEFRRLPLVAQRFTALEEIKQVSVTGNRVTFVTRTGNAYQGNLETNELLLLNKHTPAMVAVTTADGFVVSGYNDQLRVSANSQNSPHKRHFEGAKLTSVKTTPTKKQRTIIETEGRQSIISPQTNEKKEIATTEQVIATFEHRKHTVSPNGLLCAQAQSLPEQHNPVEITIKNRDNQILKRERLPHREVPTALKFSEDSKDLFIGTTKGNVLRMETSLESDGLTLLARGKRSNGKHTGTVTHLAIMNKTILSGDQEGSVRGGSKEDKRVQFAVEDHGTSGIKGIFVSENNKNFAVSVWGDSSIRVYKSNGDKIATIPTDGTPENIIIDSNKIIVSSGKHVDTWQPSALVANNVKDLFATTVAARLNNQIGLSDTERQLQTEVNKHLSPVIGKFFQEHPFRKK